MPKCGEKTGHIAKKTGQLCDQNIPTGAKGCFWFVRTPQQRSLEAVRISRIGKTRRALPASYQVKPFDSVESIITWSRDMAERCLKEDIDPRRTSEARGFAHLALSAIQTRTQEHMINALLQLEHGSSALVLLTKFQQGVAAGPRRPVPGRTVKHIEALPQGEVVS